jgi:hypothetical protein
MLAQCPRCGYCLWCGHTIEIFCIPAGYDFPWMLQNIIPYGLWGGSRQHNAHHVHGTVHYQKFFTYIDTLMGTEAASVVPPWPQVQSVAPASAGPIKHRAEY